MELYREIGKAVCRRTEKGAAVMASEYLNKQYPDAKGFSPRSLRRMRDFYRTYENQPALLCRAMKLGWIQNVVIMEAELTMELREWYMKAAKQFGWSKTELIANIEANAHEEIVLTVDEKLCDTEENYVEFKRTGNRFSISYYNFLCMIRLIILQWLLKREGRRRWRYCDLLMLDPGIEKINVGVSLYLNSICGKMFYKKCISIYQCQTGCNRHGDVVNRPWEGQIVWESAIKQMMSKPQCEAKIL